MRPLKYALEPLADLREMQVDAATRDLATAIDARRAVERRRDAVEGARDAHEGAAEALRVAEVEALARGELCAADLARADAWQARVRSERDVLASAVDRVRVEEDHARSREDGAREEVASRKTDADVVARDRARWAEAQRKRGEAAEEDASAEARRPSTPRARRKP